MQHYWLPFAATGRPRPADALPEWPAYDASAQRYLQLDHVPRNQSSHLAKENCDFWDKIES